MKRTRSEAGKVPNDEDTHTRWREDDSNLVWKPSLSPLDLSDSLIIFITASVAKCSINATVHKLECTHVDH